MSWPICQLLLTSHLPKQMAILKCKGHSKLNSAIARGNQQHAGGYQPLQMMVSTDPVPKTALLHNLELMQAVAGPYEQAIWLEKV